MDEEERTAKYRSGPVTVMISFHLLSGGQEAWMATWQQIELQANEQPDCGSFRLLVNDHEEGRCVIVTEWDDVHAFNRFVRETGLLWIERTARYSRASSTYTYMSGIREASVGREFARRLPIKALSHV